MKRLEFLKGFSAFLVLFSAYNSYFDLIRIPRQWDIHLVLSILCICLFLIGLYHDRLGRSILRDAKKGEHTRFPMSPRAGRDLLFTEGLLTFLFAIPFIPALLSFPSEPHLGLSVLLFPLHGLIRCFRTRYLRNLELILGPNELVLTLRSPHSIRYEDIRRVELKYEHLYLILKDDRVRSLPLAFLQDGGEGAVPILVDRLRPNGIKGVEELQEAFPSSTNSTE